jgi:hypothetical protein
MYSSIPDALRRLHRSGFKIVIFTNQGGIKKSEAKADEIKGKVGLRSLFFVLRFHSSAFFVLRSLTHETLLGWADMGPVGGLGGAHPGVHRRRR